MYNYNASLTCMQERHSMTTEHSKRMAEFEQELSRSRAQQNDSIHFQEQLQLQGQSANSQRDQLLEKLRQSESALTKLEAEHRQFVDRVNSACASKDEEIEVLVMPLFVLTDEC
jgi:septal ring factor EnvC (AmiA/AmiB activator)